MSIDFIFIFLGCIAGTISGMLPGIGMTVVLVIGYPLLIGFEINQILQFYLSAILISQFTGSIVATYFAIPGEVSSIPAVIEGHGLARKGQANQAIFMSAIGSFIGGIVALIFLYIIGTMIVHLLKYFGTGFNVLLITLVFIVLFLTPSKNYIEKYIFPIIGIILGLIGQLPYDRHTTFLTFGIQKLEVGVPILAVLLGLYSLPLLFKLHENRITQSIDILRFDLRKVKIKISQIFLSIFYGIYGFVLAFIPGIGLDIVSNTAYEFQKKINKKMNLTKAQENNLIASETANNSGAFSILLPFLAFGIPTNPSQVLLFNILNDKNFLFGPLSFTSELINSIITVIFFTSIAGFIIAGPLANLLAKTFKIFETHLYVMLSILMIIVTLYVGYTSLDFVLYLWTLILSTIFGFIFLHYNVLRIIYFFIITPFFAENWLRLGFMFDIL